MLGPGRYALGAAELVLIAGCAWIGAARLRERLLPGFAGAPARLATAVPALALLIWAAELLGSFGLFEPLPYLVTVVVVGVGLRVGPARGQGPGGAGRVGAPSSLLAWAALLVAAVAVVHFAGGVKTRLGTGMTGFDSTWYHAPFAAGFMQSGNTWDLHFIAPQFLAWFYPANAEIFHGIGMLAFDRDLASPLLNLGWFSGCLVACWCIGRPYGVAPWSLALGAVALSVPALSDQAGEARNDIVGIFFLLAAVAIALQAWGRGERDGGRAEADAEAEAGTWGRLGPFLVVGLAAGLAAGTKLNFLLPAAVLVVGLAVLSPRGARWPALAAAGGAALAGGGYWYLRNLAHSGNPLPWIDGIGPIPLPAPDQALGGREAHSVAGYLLDGAVWSDWLLPGLRDGLTILWPLLLAAALAGLLLCLAPRSRGSFSTKSVRKEPQVATGKSCGSLGTRKVRKEPQVATGKSCGSLGTRSVQKEPQDGSGRWERRVDPALALAGAAGLATALAWLIAPTSASGPEGMPRGFESGLRYLAPALVLGLALLPATPGLRGRLPAPSSSLLPPSGKKGGLGRTAAAVAVLAAVVIGYPVQRHYLDHRYAEPSFTTPGLNAAFGWTRDVSGARIATTSTRQYPLYGTDLSNHVQFVGEKRSHGGFEPPSTCPAWRRLLNAGDYDYVVTTHDRIAPDQPTYPPSTRWTRGPNSQVVLEVPPTVVFRLEGPLDPSSCPS